jgi:membrane peptidoglycan carboxypeptidase
MYRYVRNFGFGIRTNLGLCAEEHGIVHPVRQWSGRTLPTIAIGQEISVTLMQMAAVFSCIANDGVLMQPRIYEKIIGPSGDLVVRGDVKPLRRVVSAGTARRLKAMLTRVVESGTGKLAGIAGVPIAGKTGTSQIFDRDSGSYSDSRIHASFIGFTPVDNPVLLCAVVIDEPREAAAGGLAAAPAFGRIIRRILSDPGLEFAEQILSEPGNRQPDTPVDVRTIPQVCGMTTLRAQESCRRSNISCEITGSGDTVLYQIPRAGTPRGTDGRIMLFTAVPDTTGATVTAVPDCRGKDLREAIEILGLHGIEPYVHGSGWVRRQSPVVGTVVTTARPCSLYCSLEG